MINQYFRKAMNNRHFIYESGINIPESFLTFYSEYEPASLISLLKPDGFKYIGFGIKKSNQLIYFGDFIEVEEMKIQLTMDLENYVKKYQLLKIGYNEYTEGGMYIGLSNKNFGQIFFYRNYLGIAKNEEIVKVANSFDQLMSNAEVYGVNFDRYGNSIYTRLKISVPENVDVLAP
jgi:hypothetical protein